MGWKAIACSATGTCHIDRNVPCQDYGDYIVIDDVIVGAVADGAGSAKHSDIGSKLAVKTTLSHLYRLLRWNKRKNEDLRKPITPDIAKKTFNDTLTKVKDVLNKEVQSKGFSINDLACTLLVFCATPTWIAAMQIGDGFIVVKLKESNNYQLLFPPDKGEYANETTFVTSTNAFSRMKVDVIIGKQEFICASTDGLERLAIDFRTGEAFSGFFNPFEQGLRERDKHEEEKSLEDWLYSEGVNARTDDDKTLLVCLYEESGLNRQSSLESQSPSQLSSKGKAHNHLTNVKEDFHDKSYGLRDSNFSKSQTLPNIEHSFIAISFFCHIFAGWILSISFFLFPSFIAGIIVLLLTILVMVVTICNLKDYFIKLLQAFSWLTENSKKSLAVVLSFLLSILGIVIGFYCSQLSSSPTYEKKSRGNILQSIDITNNNLTKK
ncbi:hypothetical protein NIES21_32120 [Anabaenopsis circularis NIES-21]|uniref:PPM-type phosphatase domain-containing protein n=1 Tax=Anabaenopsis circularis NIES-21 TaxID=1085406 RepID=A0A1Z4GIT0_9CYAN|nr:hypothetical protein NIES21_32120 [Anabaenopsis circularis NIES-21]